MASLNEFQTDREHIKYDKIDFGAPISLLTYG